MTPGDRFEDALVFTARLHRTRRRRRRDGPCLAHIAAVVGEIEALTANSTTR